MNKEIKDLECSIGMLQKRISEIDSQVYKSVENLKLRLLKLESLTSSFYYTNILCGNCNVTSAQCFRIGEKITPTVCKNCGVLS